MMHAPPNVPTTLFLIFFRIDRKSTVFKTRFKYDKTSFRPIVFILVIDIFKFLKSQVIFGNLAEHDKKIADALLDLFQVRRTWNEF